MAYCSSCGAEVQGQYCQRCGAPVGIPSSSPGPGPSSTQSGLEPNVASALCYLVGLVTGVLFLALSPYTRNKTIRFHAFQSIFTHVAFIGLWMVPVILYSILPWFLTTILSIFMGLVSLGGFVLWLLLMFKAYNGERFVLPVVGPMAE